MGSYSKWIEWLKTSHFNMLIVINQLIRFINPQGSSSCLTGYSESPVAEGSNRAPQWIPRNLLCTAQCHVALQHATHLHLLPIIPSVPASSWALSLGPSPPTWAVPLQWEGSRVWLLHLSWSPSVSKILCLTPPPTSHFSSGWYLGLGCQLPIGSMANWESWPSYSTLHEFLVFSNLL